MQHNLQISTCDPINYIVNSPILNVSMCMGKSITIQRVYRKNCFLLCVCSNVSSFVDHLCYFCLVFVMLSFASVY